jgi:atypical dual specificity phosphatase
MTKIGNTYRWIYGHVVNRPTNFSWVIEGKLAGSGMPMTFSQFLWVVTHGIKTIVTLREVPLPQKWLINNIGARIEYLHLEVEDYGVPSIQDMDNTIDYIRLHIREEKPVMVHCAAGRGRTGTILAAYLLKENGLTADQAIKKIRKLRPGSIQSTTQEKAIFMYEKYLRGKAND